MKLQKLVLASGNPGKCREFADLLAPLGIEVLSQAELGIDAAQEPYQTFVENALAKARHASERSGLPALADDSGLCVDVLGGAPGVHSARYASEVPEGLTQDLANNAHLVQTLREQDHRAASYVAVLVLVRHAHDPLPLVAQASWRGEIVDLPQGEHGFGYDPHFWLPERAQTVAELPAALKNAMSHRARATKRLLAQMAEAGLTTQRPQDTCP